ncbi:CsbD family protein [Rossellomorea vietnamensis]|uniref:CsbD family protein n=1 Tax=Rossellomorea vietnamensis TaxID=218284 RepID=UPI001CCDA181|nr:CsbD family protein [Rossellomorea vietnamensis]MCA0149651.1 CsbD family protein [Rossellomorea vietnamensis]
MSENHDQASGKQKQVKGDLKKGLGKLTNDDSTIAEGERDKDKGKIQEKVGDVKESFKKNW